MRILWNSTTPEAHSGYGIVGRHLLPRIIVLGHQVRVVTKHPHQGTSAWNGIDVMDGTNGHYANQMLAEEGYQIIFSLWDIWRMREPLYSREGWAAYVPVDTEEISEALKSVVSKTRWQIAMSLHGFDELKRAGFKDAMYAPHGVDTSVFRPDLEARQKWRSQFEVSEDTFLIGSVGMNSVSDRKNYLSLMMAFRRFLADHPDSRLYLHTHAEGAHPGTLPYLEVAKCLGIHRSIIFPPQSRYDLGRLTEMDVASACNAMDLFVLPTKGEGFGLPILEAQACGVPALLTSSTSCRELQFGTADLLMDPDWDEWEYSDIGVMRIRLRPRTIWAGLERAYEMSRAGDLRALSPKVAHAAKQYSWDVVWETYWKAVWERMETELGLSVD